MKPRDTDDEFNNIINSIMDKDIKKENSKV